MSHPIPNDALDDRLAFLGTAGSGKTYNAGGAVERVLARKGRVVIVDPLDVWWGLRLDKDGKKASPHDVAIFGGRHGDLPLTENAGALIGETVAGMAESCIVSLGGFSSSAADRRFMLAFLEAIYRKADGDPFHLVVDEADLFAPQKPQHGEEKLLHFMEQIVRRGRIKGFIPWLISQRPAVLNKNVLSQADGLIALKLTSSQDRDAIGAWIEGQADKQEGKAILGSLPTMQRGQGVVWIPGRAILKTVTFPEKTTFDSSRTPKRGEKAKKAKSLKPLNIAALKDRLKTVEAETKENDPKALKAQIAELQKKIGQQDRASPKAAAPAVDTATLKKAEKHVAAYRSALEIAMKFIVEISTSDFFKDAGDQVDQKEIERVIRDATNRAKEMIGAHLSERQKNLQAVQREAAALAKKLNKIMDAGSDPVTVSVAVRKNEAFTISSASPSPAPRSVAVAQVDGITNPQLRVIRALSFYQSIGNDEPSRAMVAGVSGYSASSGGFANLLGQLNALGIVSYPKQGHVRLDAIPQGIRDVPDAGEAKDMLLRVLSNPHKKVIAAMPEDRAYKREEVAEASGYSPTSGGFANLLGEMRSIDVLDYPAQGQVVVTEWARQLLG